ncbi:MAG: KH domain-containing protein [Bdellovibrio sp.]|nr:KH domain-containing protein [Bdellovibrio sp.]
MVENHNDKNETSREHSEEHIRTLLETIIKNLVTYPQDISVTFERGERTTILKVQCTQRVVGQIIGSQGKNIQSLRTLTLGMTSLLGFRSIIEIPYFDPKK